MIRVICTRTRRSKQFIDHTSCSLGKTQDGVTALSAIVKFKGEARVSRSHIRGGVWSTVLTGHNKEAVVWLVGNENPTLLWITYP